VAQIFISWYGSRPPWNPGASLAVCYSVRIFALGAFLVLASSAHAQTPCAMGRSDHAWVNEQIDTWRSVSREALRIDPDQLPLIIVFDETCAWSIEREVRGTPHAGSLTLPDGEQVPVRLMTFAGSYGPSEKPFVVMAMPSMWRADAKHAGDADLARLIRAVFTHEMAHTVQTAGIGQWLNDIERRLGLPDDLDDDIVQTRFEGDAGFRLAFEAERDALYEAAAQKDPARRRVLVSEAVSMMEARRAKYFTDANAIYAELEDVFLNMEGLGNWVAYQVALKEGMSEASGQDFIRRGRNRWSQDEGLAAFLVIDALVPGWRAKVLQGRPASILGLLREAAR